MSTASFGESLANPSQGRASSGESLANPSQGTASFGESLANPSQGSASFGESLANPSQGRASSGESLANPSQGRASSGESLNPSQGSASFGESLANPSQGIASLIQEDSIAKTSAQHSKPIVPSDLVVPSGSPPRSLEGPSTSNVESPAGRKRPRSPSSPCAPIHVRLRLKRRRKMRPSFVTMMPSGGNDAKMVGEIFMEAGRAFMKLGEMISKTSEAGREKWTPREIGEVQQSVQKFAHDMEKYYKSGKRKAGSSMVTNIRRQGPGAGVSKKASPVGGRINQGLHTVPPHLRHPSLVEHNGTPPHHMMLEGSPHSYSPSADTSIPPGMIANSMGVPIPPPPSGMAAQVGHSMEEQTVEEHVEVDLPDPSAQGGASSSVGDKGGVEKELGLCGCLRSQDTLGSSRERIRFGGPSRERIMFGGPSRERIRFGGPSRERIMFGGPSRERIRFGGPSRERIMFGGPSRERIMFDGPSRERIMFGGPSRERIMFGGPSRERIMFGGPYREWRHLKCNSFGTMMGLTLNALNSMAYPDMGLPFEAVAEEVVTEEVVASN
ncbi:unnamed protein product [Cyprideis torosa]|uniref:Uncharacterized protein n=1 Tax=Cyprideis torosa TaxID=163714 RepID=A0A7R8ZK44_9CRUS|nr:unnamed protein product [Cyprideis torosa]CAG0889971.1 unnamed protein product [Cyprideis torosa]